MEYLSIRQEAEKWEISKRRVYILCSNGCIPGAGRIESYWMVPQDAEEPLDARVKNGKYVKTSDRVVG